jgi:ACR3 family arsenite transporter
LAIAVSIGVFESIADKHLQELLPLVEVPALIILVNVSFWLRKNTIVK